MARLGGVQTDPAQGQPVPHFIAYSSLMGLPALQLYREYHFDFSMTCVNICRVQASYS
jgi:hypothetical protein